MNLVSGRMAYTVRCLAFAAFAAIAGSAFAATAEPLDLDADILAEIARQKARSSTQARQVANAGKASKAGAAPSAVECGALAIGNVLGGNRIGFAPIDINVIIVGDVINANNRCR